MTDPTDVCRHGGLRRKCEPCDLAQEVKELRAELDALKRTREQEKDYADTCYENERLRAALESLQTRLAADRGIVLRSELVELCERALSSVGS